MPPQATTKYNLARKYPKLVAEWSPKNEKKPDQYTPVSGQKVWWVCKDGHEWSAVIHSRSKQGRGCPVCAGQVLTPERTLVAKYPAIAKEWHTTKNRPVTPEDIFPNSAKKFWWICPNGHEYEAKPNNRVNGKGCSFCRGSKPAKGASAADRFPHLLKEYSEDNPKPLSSYKPYSNKKVTWKCAAGHEWSAVINSRTANDAGCPFCTNRKVSDTNTVAAAYPELLDEWDYEKNGDFRPDMIVSGSSLVAHWKCKRGHTFATPIVRRTYGGSGCPKCVGKSSRGELRFLSEVEYVFSDVRHRQKVARVEADIFIPYLALAIEYDGAYFHKSKVNEDRAKNRKLSQAGIDVIRLREVPLKLLGQNDIQVHELRYLQKSDIDHLIKKIAALTFRAKMFPRKKVKDYLAATTLQAEKRYQELIEALPGPGDIKDSVASNKRLLSEWHTERNAPLKPYQVHLRSGMKLWWRCSKGHEWDATPDKRSTGRNCPFCSNRRLGYGNSLAVVAPSIAKEWYQPGNGSLTPQTVTAGSGKKVWWICSMGHKFRAAVVDRVNRQSGCVHCPGPGKNRKYSEPDI
jgi:hypothetical protein